MLSMYKAIVRATFLYSAELWACLYTDRTEAVQTRFLKSILSLPINTPHYLVRLETGYEWLKVILFKAMLKWWVKLLQMPDKRLPRICFLNMVGREGGSLDYNWASQLRSLLVTVDADNLWLQQDLRTIQANLSDMVLKMRNHCLSLDINRALNSQYNTTYRMVSTLGESESYLRLRSNFKKIKFICQIRLSSDNWLRFSISGIQLWLARYVFYVTERQNR
uniref:Putative endonuclease-reverse transcriptase n=1 Tax=Panstrongylus lignarius TaxID=156445 RepID=A0A224XXD6_9HEMI